jgi:hypothetical protein
MLLNFEQLLSIIKRYNLYVYNTAGTKVAESTKDLNNNTEKVKISLPAGTYTAVALAFNDTYGTIKSDIAALSTAYTYTEHNKIFPTRDPYESWIISNYNFKNVYYNDYFYKKTTFTVSSAPVNVTMIAPRITGRLHLTYNDINGDAGLDYGLVRVGLKKLPFGVKFSNDNYYRDESTEYYYFSKAEWKAFASKAMIINCMATDNTAKITLDFIKTYMSAEYSYQDFTAPNIVYTREISGFNVYQNKITKLSGNIFDNGGFNISIDTDWDGEVTGEF